MKNILIISDKYEKEMAKEMWKQNTEYTIMHCNDINDPDFLKYIDKNAIGIIGWAECDSKIQNNQMIAGLKMAANLTESSKS